MLATIEIVAHDSEIVEGHVCKMRAACAVPHRPHVWRSRLKTLIHLDVAPLIQLDAGSFQADSLRIRCPPCRNQNVAPFDILTTLTTTNLQADTFTRKTIHLHRLCGEQHLDPIVLEELKN